MAIRYVRQRDNRSCGPVAVLNTIKWLDRKLTYANLPSLQFLCKCKKNGTLPIGITRALEFFNINYKQVLGPTLKQINKHIDNDGIIIVDYFYSPSDGHYTVCIGRTKHYYKLLNDVCDRTTSKISKKYMMEMIKYWHVNKKLCTWFIYRD